MRLDRVWGDETGPGAGAMRVARLCVLVLSLALPVSIAVTEGALVLGLFALAVSRVRGRDWTFARSGVEWGALAIAVAWLLASACSREPSASFFNVRKLYALGLIWLAAESLRERAVRERFVPALMWGASLTAVVGLVIFAVKVRVDAGYRLQSLLSNQMTSGGVLAAAAIWGVGAVTDGPWARRWTALVRLLPILAGLALTQTRSHWLGFAFGVLALLLARAPRLWWTVPAGASLVALVAPPRILGRLASIVDPSEPGNRGRLSMWRSGWDIVREHPWVGVGCQDLLALYRRYRYPDATFESGHFHNNIVQFAVMSGLVGLIAFLTWVFACLERLVRAARTAGPGDRGLAASALGVFVALMVSGMFDFTFGDAEVVYQSYLAVGVALALLPSRPKAQSPGGR